MGVTLPKVEYIKRTSAEGQIEYYFVGYTRYVDKKTGNWIEIFDGEVSDGATGAFDVHSLSWWIHDAICRDGCWHGPEKTPIGAKTAARVLSQILWSEGRYFRSIYWGPFTYLFGCKKVRANGWLK